MCVAKLASIRLRLLVYNIRYATGTGPAFHLPFPGAGYLRSSRRVLDAITSLVKEQDPDKFMPIVRKQGNAFLAAPRVEGERFHYFDTGIKRLIIELELDDVCIFLVHLALKYRQRQYQLRYLHDLIIKSHKPVIVTGDFNTFWGTHEIYLFMRAAGLRSANEKNLPSFPARIPRIELDFVLVSKEIEITNFQVPDVRWSDHRPILCDFYVRGAVASQPAVA